MLCYETSAIEAIINYRTQGLMTPELGRESRKTRAFTSTIDDIDNTRSLKYVTSKPLLNCWRLRKRYRWKLPEISPNNYLLLGQT
jgi:hypothetical protein